MHSLAYYLLEILKNVRISVYAFSTIFTMVLCSLPTTSISDPPTSVSLVRDICEGPQNHLRVIDLRKRRQNFEKLSSNASNIISRNKVSNFTICIPPLFGDYMTTGELIEFIEMNRLLGADKFILYLASPKKELISCLLSYARVGLVELNNWTIPFKQEDINYNGQILTQNECLFRSMYRTKYLINQDFDEFIIPTRTTDWQSMLDVIHKNKSPGERDVAASYNFRNLFFPMEAARDASLKESFTIGNYELKILTKTTCFDTLNPWKQRSKVMGRPERILIWHVHEILDSSLVREGDVNVLVDGADGLLFHYRQLGSSSNTTNRRTWIYQKQLFVSVTSRASTSGCMI